MMTVSRIIPPTDATTGIMNFLLFLFPHDPDGHGFRFMSVLRRISSISITCYLSPTYALITSYDPVLEEKDTTSTAAQQQNSLIEKIFNRKLNTDTNINDKPLFARLSSASGIGPVRLLPFRFLY